MGRPKSKDDPILIELVRIECGRREISLSQLALSIGVSPSTLTRSMKSGCFSAELRRKLAAWLDPAAEAGGAGDQALGLKLQKALHLITELQELMPDLQKRLVAAIDREQRLGQTAE